MMIFTPAASFCHTLVKSVDVLTGIAKDAHSESVPARLRVGTYGGSGGDCHLFYGDEAASVLAQLVEAGVFTAQQGSAHLVRLRDEMEMAEARGISSEH